jgi:hypothetical protein
MNEKKIVVPEGMMRAAVESLVHCWDRIPRSTDYSSKQVTLAKSALEAALCWLSENPPEITTPMRDKAREHCDGHAYPEFRYMFKVAFLKEPESGVPEAVKDLWEGYIGNSCGNRAVQADILEAYRRGKEEK